VRAADVYTRSAPSLSAPGGLKHLLFLVFVFLELWRPKECLQKKMFFCFECLVIKICFLLEIGFRKRTPNTILPSVSKKSYFYCKIHFWEKIKQN
jgi:hypothetical protein